MNPATALATVLVDELVRGGVREVVLAPGSRSAPLAYAVQQAERDGRLRPGARVLVVYGAGHGYWLRHFARETPGYRLVDVRPYLRDAAR